MTGSETGAAGPADAPRRWQARRRAVRRKRRALLAALAVLAVAVPGAERSVRAEQAQSIAFAIAVVPEAVGADRLEAVYFAGMVDPDGCTGWYSDLPQGRSWTWNNNGKNVTRFALTVGFTVEGGGEPRVATRCVSVDPENMAHARPTVNIELAPCELAPGKAHLRLDEIRQPGVKVHRIAGEGACR